MNLCMRVATSDDAPAICAVYEPYVRKTSITFETQVPTPDEIKRRVSSVLEFYPWLVCTDADTLMGYAYAGAFNKRAAYQWSVETSIYLARAYQGCGIGRSLYTTLIALLRAQGFCNAYAGITLPNPASITLHTALGFQHIGTFGGAGFKHDRWHDVGWWALELTPRTVHVSPPTPFTELPAAVVQATCAAGIERNLN